MGRGGGGVISHFIPPKIAGQRQLAHEELVWSAIEVTRTQKFTLLVRVALEHALDIENQNGIVALRGETNEYLRQTSNFSLTT